MPGNTARLFDIKRAIVRSKKYDRNIGPGNFDFELICRNANTNEEYVDENMLLPRGTRLIVQRVAASNGNGFLARIARSAAGGGQNTSSNNISNSNSNSRGGYYTFESKDGDEQDEFVDNEQPAQDSNNNNNNPSDQKELAALQAALDQGANSNNHHMGGIGGVGVGAKVWTNGMPTTSGISSGPKIAGQNNTNFMNHNMNRNTNSRVRPNADPELREQERLLALQQQSETKKRKTGVPRTFLNFDAPAGVDGGGVGGDGNGMEGSNEDNGDGEGAGTNKMITILPNTTAFEELVTHKGGKSSNDPSRSLDYMLQVTSTEVPAHLKCGICSKLVKNAMFLFWDEEGRSACELCIREALEQGNFRCPLTGKEGISPDDLHPDHRLRKDAEKFRMEVLGKVEEMEKEQLLVQKAEEEAAMALKAEEQAKKKQKQRMYDDAGDSGLVFSNSTANHKKGLGSNDKGSKRGGGGGEDDPFGEDDAFGGDVFDVMEEEKVDEEEAAEEAPPVNDDDDTLLFGEENKAKDEQHEQQQQSKSSLILSDNKNLKTKKNGASITSTTDVNHDSTNSPNPNNKDNSS
eukprot:CAMPEP_0178968166 /NCGR_PEP_ID=MMETSP0789-20121207/18050_1 /TAXON_ID=3005 /ORGANISM="Rhizosolenia setigera, Strain CCMP 1694" /LENGTH=575 /DNA_ID=CAMNT_0020653959 /DNA_START=237 /DNA_END=1961 /DNA_ORIENTATION=-